MARKRIADQTKGIGKPKVGGSFELVDQDGNVFSSNDMLGKYSLVRPYTNLTAKSGG
jgi:protein SCO1/2